MSRSRLRLLISLLVVSALALGGVAHAPMAVASIATGGAVVAASQPPCHEMGAPQQAPVKAQPTPDCCLLFCTSLPATTTPATRPLHYASVAFVLPGELPLVPRTLSPEPGPPRA